MEITVLEICTLLLTIICLLLFRIKNTLKSNIEEYIETDVDALLKFLGEV